MKIGDKRNRTFLNVEGCSHVKGPIMGLFMNYIFLDSEPSPPCIRKISKSPSQPYYYLADAYLTVGREISPVIVVRDKQYQQSSDRDSNPN